MKVNIKGNTLDLHYSMRIYLIYETITGKSISLGESSFSTLVSLLYSAILGTMQYKRMNLDLDWDTYLDWLDTQKPEILNEFSKWFIGCVNVNNDLIEEDNNQNKNTKKEELDEQPARPKNH